MNRLPPDDDVYVLALPKKGERYLIIYDEATRTEALRTLIRWAKNPELSFTYADAVSLSQKIRRISEGLDVVDELPQLPGE